MLKRSSVYLFFFLCSKNILTISHTNFFKPYEWLLDINRLFIPNETFANQLAIRLEYGYAFKGFPIDPKEAIINSYNVKTITANPCQYSNQKETIYCLFLGQTADQEKGEIPQQFKYYNGLKAGTEYEIKGNFSLKSLTASYELWITKNFKCGYYIPFYWLDVKNINTKQLQQNETIESTIYPELFREKLNIQPYKLHGAGDSELLLSWQQYFYEDRDFITGLLAALRIGLYLPTASHRDTFVDTFLKLPLGYDAAWGIPFGGSIELELGPFAGAGISADCITFFDHLLDRYIKTDMRQTDLFTSEKVRSLLHPGFKETFSAYVTAHDYEKNTLGTIAYQYNKQNESDITVCDPTYINLIAQSSELLESWTAHNLIFTIQGKREVENIHLFYNGFFKLGFHGMRAIVGNSFGFQISCLF
jgi:hypothetical protein